MNDISTLLKEAKPLYIARKKRKRQVLTGLPLMVFCCAVAVAGFINNSPIDKKAELNALYASIYDSGKFNEMFAGVDSVIADMGLPVDEFGLLAADWK